MSGWVSARSAVPTSQANHKVSPRLSPGLDTALTDR